MGFEDQWSIAGPRAGAFISRALRTPTSKSLTTGTKPMMRVAMITVHTCPLAKLGSRETGGMNVYIRELSRHLGAAGVPVDVFTRRQATDVREEVEFGPNARVIHLDAGPRRPMDKYRVLDHLPEFAANVRAFRERDGVDYDVVHSHYWLSAPVAADLAESWQVPMVAMFHTLGKVKNHVSNNGHETEKAERIRIEYAAMESSERVVAASPTDMQQMISYYEADPSRISVIPEGVDTGLFHPFNRSAARAEVGMNGEPQILFVGRIQQLKGIDLLLHAFAIVLKDWSSTPPPRLTIVGGVSWAGPADPEAEERGRLTALARSLGVESQVSFRDAVAHRELPHYYSAADVVVVPSTYESFGLVALEAMACGTPVVASRVGGLQWTVRDAETGFLVPRRTPEAFASALSRVLGDSRLRLRMSEAAVRTAGAYSWAGVADRVMSLYDELLPSADQPLVAGTCSCGNRR